MEDSDSLALAANRLKGLAYARMAGIATGAFLLIWIPFNGLRWSGEAPNGLLAAESVVFGIVGILLLLPWKRLQEGRWWKPLLALLCLGVVAFTFTMVIDLIFQYMLAADEGLKPAPPAFQSLLLFIVLMQPAVMVFQRRPELLD